MARRARARRVEAIHLRPFARRRGRDRPRGAGFARGRGRARPHRRVDRSRHSPSSCRKWATGGFPSLAVAEIRFDRQDRAGQDARADRARRRRSLCAVALERSALCCSAAAEEAAADPERHAQQQRRGWAMRITGRRCPSSSARPAAAPLTRREQSRLNRARGRWVSVNRGRGRDVLEGVTAAAGF